LMEGDNQWCCEQLECPGLLQHTWE
jgi:hypothetical protein